MRGFAWFQGVVLGGTAMASTLAFTAQSQIPRTCRPQFTTNALYAVRYGPPPNADGMSDPRPSRAPQPSSSSQKEDFRLLLEKIMSVQDPQHIPSLLTKNMELVLRLSGQDGVAVVQSILDEAKETQDQVLVSQLEEAIDMTISFAEDFVNTASSLDDQNKQLLGKIIRAMSNKDLAPREREEALDALFTQEKEKFSAGFLRHLEGECDKITRSPVLNPDSARTLEMLRIIQTRVLEEIGTDLGEAAQVLGQLIGYDNEAERCAVLEAGLVVRGVDFAKELQELTTEALDGLARVPGNAADPNLIRIVQSIDASIRRYLEKETTFQ
eukprot:scaffold425_cov175-Amphora_coffeaeformis.AAC.39